MSYEFGSVMPGLGEGIATGALGMVVAILIIIMLLALGFSIVSYVLSAVGMYRIAKRRGIHHAWLAWVPVGNAWLLGSISDHYQYVVKHKVTKRRRVLLILGLITAGFGFVYGLLAGLTGAAAGVAGGVGMTAAMILAYLALMGISIASTVICYIAYYDLFISCKPGSAVLFLVLGIFINVTLPFFVFACSNSDEGMPARRAPRPPVQNTYVPEQPEVEIVETTEDVDDFEIEIYDD